MILVPWQRLQLARNGSFGIPRVALGHKTSRLVLSVRRETSSGQMIFPGGSLLLARLAIRGGAEDFVTTGRIVGGVRGSFRGGDIELYVGSYGLPWGFFGQRSGKPRRLGEHKAGLDVSVDFVLDGDPIDTEWQLEVLEQDAPDVPFKNSVAFDAATDKGEAGGGNVIDLTHTSTGSNRGMFLAVGNSGGIPVATTTIEYNAVAQTEIWDETQNNVGNSGWYGVNQPTGAQLVEADFPSSADEAVLSVISMTDVHQTTPCNVDTEANHVHKLGSGNTSMTKTAPGTITSDDLVLGFTYIAHSVDPAIAQGADQTERTSEKPATGVHGASSTQPGSVSPAVVSVTMVGSAFGAIHGVVAFKTATVGASNRPYQPISALQAVNRASNF